MKKCGQFMLMAEPGKNLEARDQNKQRKLIYAPHYGILHNYFTVCPGQ